MRRLALLLVLLLLTVPANRNVPRTEFVDRQGDRTRVDRQWR